MSSQNDEAAKAVADAILNICSSVVLDELSINDIKNQLQVHPFLVNKTGEELEQLNFGIVLGMVTCAVRFMTEERNNEPDRC